MRKCIVLAMLCFGMILPGRLSTPTAAKGALKVSHRIAINFYLYTWSYSTNTWVPWQGKARVYANGHVSPPFFGNWTTVDANVGDIFTIIENGSSILTGGTITSTQMKINI